MVGESNTSKKKNGKKVVVAKTIDDKDDSLDTLGREIDDFYLHERDSEVNKAESNDDDDENDEDEDDHDENDDERSVITNVNLTARTSIPMNTTHPTSSTSTVQPPLQTEQPTTMNEDNPPTPLVADDFIQSPPIE
ncbi:hypothetical protein Tco_1024593 [Tanacetum coccineum]